MAGKIMFGIWGGCGFFGAVMGSLFVSVWSINALLIWIGGMVFFGFAALINRPN